MALLPDLALARGDVDRVAHRRHDDDWLERAWHDPTSRALLVDDGRVPVSADGTELAWCPPAEVVGGERYLLGVAGGVASFAVRDARQPRPEHRAGVRELGGLLGADDAGLLVHAVALANWHATHRYCPRCGCPTQVVAAGAERRCVVDGSAHFPRTDPAVIVLVTDPADRALLGRQHSWPEGRFSTLAGFVEPGEDAERALRREVAEESAVIVDEVEYRGSQPWPFPASLMLGFRARCRTPQPAVPDGSELVEVRWLSRTELDDGLASGAVTLPPPVSIARRLIEDWYGGPITVTPADRAPGAGA